MQAIWGPDGQDDGCQNAWFQWNADTDLKKLRIGYLKDDFEKPWIQPMPTLAADATPEEKKAYERRKANEPATMAAREYDRKFDLAALGVFKKMGVTLIPVEIPKFPYDAMRSIYTIEGAAAFDDLTLSGRDKLLYEASQSAWPNSFRAERFYPAVEYIQTMRARTLAIRAFAKVFEQVDIIVTPTTGPSNQVTVTNLNQGGGPNTMVSLTFLGGLYKDADTCAFAHAYQQATGFHKLHPPLA
jgi:Asp-tRNA(Asn)/Glu-tRNA(Gln) amidotransferase A subunit family amidase